MAVSQCATFAGVMGELLFKEDTAHRNTEEEQNYRNLLLA
jgi:hypothetical protein